jgi:hypothetical protein
MKALLVLIPFLLLMFSCGIEKEIDSDYANYSESDFLADIRIGIELDQIADRILESDIAELHGAEIAGIGFVTFKENEKDQYMISENLETHALDLLIRGPKKNTNTESVEIIWPLEWAGKSFEEFSANKSVEETEESAPTLTPTNL